MDCKVSYLDPHHSCALESVDVVLRGAEHTVWDERPHPVKPRTLPRRTCRV